MLYKPLHSLRPSHNVSSTQCYYSLTVASLTATLTQCYYSLIVACYYSLNHCVPPTITLQSTLDPTLPTGSLTSLQEQQGGNEGDT